MDLVKRRSTVKELILMAALVAFSSVQAGAEPVSDHDLQIEVTKKGLGKQVVITQGAREWFMLIDVTSEHSVVVRQEKDHERYLVDETETHDRPMTQGEVDDAIANFVAGVKTHIKQR